MHRTHVKVRNNGTAYIEMHPSYSTHLDARSSRRFRTTFTTVFLLTLPEVECQIPMSLMLATVTKLDRTPHSLSANPVRIGLGMK